MPLTLPRIQSTAPAEAPKPKFNLSEAVTGNAWAKLNAGSNGWLFGTDPVTLDFAGRTLTVENNGDGATGSMFLAYDANDKKGSGAYIFNSSGDFVKHQEWREADTNILVPLVAAGAMMIGLPALGFTGEGGVAASALSTTGAAAAGIAPTVPLEAVTLGSSAVAPVELGAVAGSTAVAAGGGEVLGTLGAIAKGAGSVAGIVGALASVAGGGASRGNSGGSFLPPAVSTPVSAPANPRADGGSNFVGAPSSLQSIPEGKGETTVIQAPASGGISTLEIAGFAIALAGFIWQVRKGKK